MVTTTREQDAPQEKGDTRQRILDAAAELIAQGGSDAATTRAVASAAGVQAPTLYRLFGDKQGLLNAVAEAALARYVADKSQRPPEEDSVEDLRRGWHDHVAFGLANPAIFGIMSTSVYGSDSPAAAAGLAKLSERVRRIARAGRLRVSEERAVALIQAMGTGTVLTLLGKAPAQQVELAEAALGTVLSAILGEAMPEVTGAAPLASALRPALDETAVLSPGERHLLDELLQRIAAGG